MRSLDDLARLPGVWLGASLAEVRTASVPTGFARLDRELPGGGWPTGALTEVHVDAQGIGEVGLLLPALARLTRAGRWLAWIAPPQRPYPPALAQAGIDLTKLIVVAPGSAPDIRWAIEQTLRAGVCAAVLAWPEPLAATAAAKKSALKYAELRRLQLAAESAEALAVLFRPHAAAGSASPAALRLSLAAQPDGRLAVHPFKRRGAPAAEPVLLDLARHAVDRGPSAVPRARRLHPADMLN